MRHKRLSSSNTDPAAHKKTGSGDTKPAVLKNTPAGMKGETASGHIAGKKSDRIPKKLKILKFGGTSVGSPERIRTVARLIRDDAPKIVVLSAMSGTTDKLSRIASLIARDERTKAAGSISLLEFRYVEVVNALYNDEPRKKEALDAVIGIFRTLWDALKTSGSAAAEKRILAQGELLSTLLMHLYLQQEGVPSMLLPALEFMRTNKNGEPDMRFIRRNLKKRLEACPGVRLFITQGYICRNDAGEIDNLRRGGSDYSASLIGAAAGAEEIQIWTDIDGLHNNDPRIVRHTRPVRRLNFEEASKLAHFGAKILHPTCIHPAREKHIPVRLLNTLQPDAPGTLICDEAEKGRIKAVAAKDDMTYIKIKSSRTLPAYRFFNRVFGAFARHRVPVDMVATSETGISVSLDNKEQLEEIVTELRKFATVTVEENMIVVCVVGDLEWHNIGFEAKIIGALRDIPVRMISYGGSNSNVSLVIRSDDKKRALEALNTRVFA